MKKIKYRFGLLVSMMVLLVGCDSQKGPLEIIDNDVGGSNNNSNENNTLNGYQVTFQTYGDNFANQLPKRTQLSGGSNNSGSVEKMKKFFTSGLMYDDVLSNLSFSGYVQSLDAFEGVVHLCLGSSSQSGMMTWTSTRKILKVEATVINYYKTYTTYVENQPVEGLTSDNMAHFQIDDTDYSLELTESLVPEEKTFSKTFGNEGTNSFSFSSADGRVLIDFITITWKI